MKVGVVDYDAGNLKSIESALNFLKIDFIVSKDPQELMAMDRLVFPGVGEARAAMTVLVERGLDRLIVSFAQSGKPLLGICLGSQILMDFSEERDTRCLGIFRGEVHQFSKDLGVKVPHMGWNQVNHRNRHPIFKGIPDGSSFYFVHSFYVKAGSADLEIADTEYAISFTSGIAQKNVIAFQFHPEKSGKHGLLLLQNFFEMEEF